MQLEEYTNIILKNNYFSSQIEDRENEEYICITYEKTVSGKRFFYFATTHKANDAFWLIQFACKKDDKDDFKNKFLEWANTITFE